MKELTFREKLKEIMTRQYYYASDRSKDEIISAIISEVRGLVPKAFGSMATDGSVELLSVQYAKGYDRAIAEVLGKLGEADHDKD